MRPSSSLVAAVGLILIACNSVDRGPGFSTGPDDGGTPLAVTGTVPADSATGVLLTTIIQATMSADLDATTVTAQSFVVTSAAGDTVSGLLTQTVRTITLEPAAPLAALTDYIATVTTAVTDSAGNALPAPFSWSLTTGN